MLKMNFLHNVRGEIPVPYTSTSVVCVYHFLTGKPVVPRDFDFTNDY